MADADVPSSVDGIDSPSAALDALCAYNGATILNKDYAAAIADQFDVMLSERASQLQPIHRMDRLQPDNDDLGIGVGSLCKTIVESIDGIQAVDPVACGHGRTQRMLKEENIDLLVDSVRSSERL